MKLIHDYLLVKEIIPKKTIGNTGLQFKYDDSDRFMTVEIVERSELLANEYYKYLCGPSTPDASALKQLKILVDDFYSVGNKLLINRVAKTPFKDGLYFISFKDVICVLSDDEI